MYGINWETRKLLIRSRMLKKLNRSKYQPHQGAQECARRRGKTNV